MAMYDELQNISSALNEPKLPIWEQLQRRRIKAKETLQDIDNAIKALKDNPQFEHMLNVLAKVTNRI